MERKPPIIHSTDPPPDNSKAAAFVFVHGLDDEAEGIENGAQQFQTAGKLPYMTWVIPNALENRDLATTAWFIPTLLSPYPPSRPELEDDEDEEGMLVSVKHPTKLVDDLVKQGIPKKRIVPGGFSQGHAIGLVELSGYLPIPDRIPSLRAEAGLPENKNSELITIKEHDGMGHVLGAAELRDLCIWLERRVPPL